MPNYEKDTEIACGINLSLLQALRFAMMLRKGTSPKIGLTSLDYSFTGSLEVTQMVVSSTKNVRFYGFSEFKDSSKTIKRGQASINLQPRIHTSSHYLMIGESVSKNQVPATMNIETEITLVHSIVAVLNLSLGRQLKLQADVCGAKTEITVKDVEIKESGDVVLHVSVEHRIVDVDAAHHAYRTTMVSHKGKDSFRFMKIKEMVAVGPES